MAQRPDGFQAYSPLNGAAVYSGGETEETGSPANNADPIIDGVQYRSIEGFANNDQDPQKALQKEITLLISGGLTPINHPQYGWIVPAGDKFDAVHDPNYYAKHEGFLSKLFTLMPVIIPALMTGTGALAGLDSMAAGAAAGASGFTGAGAADLAMEIAPGMTVAEGAAGLTTAEQAAIGSNFGSEAGGLINAGADATWGVNAGAPGSVGSQQAIDGVAQTLFDPAYEAAAGNVANTAASTLGSQQAIDGVAQTLFDPAYAANMGGSSWGWFDTATKWAKDNQLLASTGLNVAGGLIKGAMTPSPQEQAKALADAKVESETRLADARRANNNLIGLNVSRVAPRPGARLVRPGIINNNIR